VDEAKAARTADAMRDTPDGIPRFVPSAWAALQSVFSPRKFRLLAYKGPFPIDDLAHFAARMEVVKVFRQKYLDAGYVVLQLSLFILSTQVPSATLSGGWYSPFTSQPDKLLWWKVWLDAVYLCGMFFLYFPILAGWRLAQGRTPRLKPDDFAELASELRRTTFGMQQHRDLIFLIGTLTTILTLCWVLHWLVGLTFKVQADDHVAARLLSGSEFVYFFLTTFTTGGLGDIFPATTGSRLLTLFINFLTLVAIIYWFNLMARRRAPTVALAKTLSAYFEQHKQRLTGLADTAQRAKVKDPKPGSMVDGLVFCPARHKDRSDARSCLCCRGIRLVSPDLAVAYAAWPPMKWRDFFMAVNRLTPKQYRNWLKS
jgi:hypothetical protein